MHYLKQPIGCYNKCGEIKYLSNNALIPNAPSSYTQIYDLCNVPVAYKDFREKELMRIEKSTQSEAVLRTYALNLSPESSLEQLSASIIYLQHNEAKNN